MQPLQSNQVMDGISKSPGHPSPLHLPSKSPPGSPDGKNKTVPPLHPIWHPQQEKLLKQWGEVATCNRWLHYHSHMMYVRWTKWFTLPVIILSSLTGTLNFAQSSFPPQYQSMAPLIIGTVNLITGLITTIGSFLRVSELAEGNRVAALSYCKLASNIRVELLLPPSERTMNGSDFIALCRAEIDRLNEQTPDIPKKVEKQFKQYYKKWFTSIDDNEFYTPDILTLRSVEIFKEKAVVLAAKTDNKKTQDTESNNAKTILESLSTDQKEEGKPKGRSVFDGTSVRKWPKVENQSDKGQTVFTPTESTVSIDFLKEARQKELDSLKENGIVTKRASLAEPATIIHMRPSFGTRDNPTNDSINVLPEPSPSSLPSAVSVSVEPVPVPVPAPVEAVLVPVESVSAPDTKLATIALELFDDNNSSRK